MQRKGVPGIDGCLCEIKEKLKALYDRTHACILRINGKTPDGNGDITIDLSDAIPGRYVESVNGQDGNIIIDKASVGLSNVDNVSSSQILNQADANNQSRLEAFEAAKLDPIELEVTANSGRIIQLEGQQVVLDDKMEQTIQYVDAIGDDVAEIKDAYVDKTTTQYITGKKYVPTAGAGDYEGMIANVDYVSRTNPATRQNNLLHIVGNEKYEGYKDSLWTSRQQNNNTTGNTSPDRYIAGVGFAIIGSDEGYIASMGFEKDIAETSRLVLRAYGNMHEGNIKSEMQIHFIFDEVNKQIRMQPARVSPTGQRTFGTPQTLMTWQ